jgi:hypothetical protein
MGRVKDYFWDEIEAFENDQEPDFSEYEAKIEEDIRTWYSHFIGQNFKGGITKDITDMYWSWYIGANSYDY